MKKILHNEIFLFCWIVTNSIFFPFSLQFSVGAIYLSTVSGLAIGLIWVLSNNNRISIAYDILKIQALFLLIEFPIVLFGLCNDLVSKFLISSPIFVFLCTVGYKLGKSTNLEVWKIATRKSAKLILTIVFFSLLLEVLLPGLFPESHLKYHVNGLYSGFFNEPSQLAFLVFPIVIIPICSENRIVRNYGWMALVFLILLSQSSTLVVLVFIWILFRLFYLNSLLNFLIALFLVLTVSLIIVLNGDFQSLANLLDRIDGVFLSNLETSNISSLVYLQGFQDSIENLIRTNGFGLGANMMGCSPLPDIPARDALFVIDPEMADLNNSDGSYIASKLVSEFGLIGVIFLIVILITFFKKLSIFRKNEWVYSTRVMQLSIFFALIEIIFIRSTGYFSGTLILIFTIMGSFRRFD